MVTQYARYNVFWLVPPANTYVRGILLRGTVTSGIGIVHMDLHTFNRLEKTHAVFNTSNPSLAMKVFPLSKFVHDFSISFLLTIYKYSARGSCPIK